MIDFKIVSDQLFGRPWTIVWFVAIKSGTLLTRKHTCQFRLPSQPLKDLHSKFPIEQNKNSSSLSYYITT